MISLDSRLKGDVLLLRDSMVKFPGSDSTDIEICDGAYKPLPLFLNQQVIKIFEDMGIDDDFFLHHQAKEVQRLRSATSDSANASKFIKAQAVATPIRLSWFIKTLSTLGLSFQEDDFLRSVLEITVLAELRALKYKARIPVDQGYTLFGIMDETGILEEGQIFCIVDVNGQPKVLVRNKVIVTRSPALHPGDVQLANAVSVPLTSPLMQLRNCVCFSQKGVRDLPSMLSGGDLDGDIYQILFDSRAMPKCVYAPAEYHAETPKNLGRPVERQDMTDFFIEFMATDQLGRIATLHKVLADQQPQGTEHQDCLRLAQLHSTAVDFSKSGIPVSPILMCTAQRVSLMPSVFSTRFLTSQSRFVLRGSWWIIMCPYFCLHSSSSNLASPEAFIYNFYCVLTHPLLFIGLSTNPIMSYAGRRQSNPPRQPLASRFPLPRPPSHNPPR